MFDQRLQATFDFFTRSPGALSIDRPVMPGPGMPTEHIVKLRTTGWETSIGWNDQIGKDWNYQLMFVLADWQSEVIQNEFALGALSEFYTGFKPGEIWGYETEGIFQTEQEVADAPDQSRLGNN